MIIGKVTGSVHATQKDRHLAAHRLLLVRPMDLDGNFSGPSFVALDRVDAGPGDTVLMHKEGGGARIIFQDDKIPVQSVVIAVVDRVEVREEYRRMTGLPCDPKTQTPTS